MVSASLSSSASDSPFDELVDILAKGYLRHRNGLYSLPKPETSAGMSPPDMPSPPPFSGSEIELDCPVPPERSWAQNLTQGEPAHD